MEDFNEQSIIDFIATAMSIELKNVIKCSDKIELTTADKKQYILKTNKI